MRHPLSTNPTGTPRRCPTHRIRVRLPLATVEELDHLAALHHVTRQQILRRILAAGLSATRLCNPPGPTRRAAHTHAQLTHIRSIELAAPGAVRDAIAPHPHAAAARSTSRSPRRQGRAVGDEPRRAHSRDVGRRSSATVSSGNGHARPDQIPSLGGEFAWMVMFTPEWAEAADQHRNNVVAFRKGAKPVTPHDANHLAGADIRGFYAALGILLPWATREASVRCFADPDAHRRGDRDPSCSVNLTHGAWHCHGCGASGGPYDAATYQGHSSRSAIDLMICHGLTQRRAPASRQREHPILRNADTRRRAAPASPGSRFPRATSITGVTR